MYVCSTAELLRKSRASKCDVRCSGYWIVYLQSMRTMLNFLCSSISVPNAAPSSVKLKPVSNLPDSLMLTWESLPVANIQGVLKGYSILYCKTNISGCSGRELHELTLSCTIHFIYKLIIVEINFNFKIVSLTTTKSF